MYVVVSSRCETEYMEVVKATSELTWLKHLLKELGVKVEDQVVLWCDNVGATSIAADLVHHARTKHMEIHVPFCL